MLEVLRFVNIFCAGIAAGTFVMVLVALIPLVRGLQPADGLRVHQTIDPLIDRYNPAAVAVAALAAVIILVLDRNLSSAASLLYSVGLLGNLGVAIMSLGFNMRINRLMGNWSLSDVPAEYSALRERWNRFHAIRTTCGLLALACYILATLV